MDQTKEVVRYDPAYVRIPYPGGDVPADTGVCTDVVIRAYRRAFQYDLQKAVHEDMKAHFSKYPQNWGLSRPDPDIDHRRVPNLQGFLKRKGGVVAGDGRGWGLPAGGSDHLHSGGAIAAHRDCGGCAGWWRGAMDCTQYRPRAEASLNES
jgi:uncharacterized protein YijF (DUF1287 family)